jgi:hypothetical protein
MEKVRIAGQLYYGQSPQEVEYGRDATLLLLEGRVDDVIDDFSEALAEGRGSSAKADTLQRRALGYFRNLYILSDLVPVEFNSASEDYDKVRHIPRKAACPSHGSSSSRIVLT